MRKKMLLGVVVVAVLASLLVPSIVNAPMSTSTVYIDPPIMWDPAMEIGTEFSINICVDYVENLWAYQFWLAFDPAVIHGVSVENGPFLGSVTHPIYHPVIVAEGAGFDNEVGELKLFGAFIKFEVIPPHDRWLADGGGVLATVTFVKVGDGCSKILLGEDTQLADKYADEIPSTLEDGYFSNLIGPELYIRRRGAHGASGVWPEWTVGDSEMEQTLYSRILNYGFMGAWVQAKIVVRSEIGGTSEFWTEEVWLDSATWVGDEIVPSEVTVSVSFTPEIVGKYWVYGILYFKAGCMEDMAPYYLVEENLDGEGLSRDVAVGFKVQ
ncbi:MAG: cohesin domain-containing protein [Candidatus Bathyarchaeota archaeon]|nr:cohesin domain-containing protein [Candidatus Bathyarchaeota archaeon]